MYLVQVFGYALYEYLLVSIVVALALWLTIPIYFLRVVFTERLRNRHSGITILVSLFSIPTMWLMLTGSGIEPIEPRSFVIVFNSTERDVHVEVGNNHSSSRNLETFNLSPSERRRLQVSLFRLGICTDVTPCATVYPPLCDGYLQWSCLSSECSVTIENRGRLHSGSCPIDR